jgi:3-dehydroquinate dehydratase/shikimate dehydrogenase
VDKSVGHLFHNRSFPNNAIYVKFHVAIPELTSFFSLMRKLPFHGFSITMPLKEQLDRFLTRSDSAATAIGSVNTILIDEGHLIGYNTDGIAVASVLLHRMKSLRDRKVVLLGAGGSARAIAYELLQYGASVLCLNRTFERAEALAIAFGCRAGRLEDLGDAHPEILINTIPKDLLFSSELFSPSMIVMDLIYWEHETPLLNMAKQRGCTCITGIEIFEEQARAQQKIWFDGELKKSAGGIHIDQ